MKTQKFGYKKLYINGELVDGVNAKKIDVICPATGEVIAQVAAASKTDTENALVAAQKGFTYWSRLSLAERTTWMHKLSEAIKEKEHNLRTAMVHEMGKTYAGAYEDIEGIINGLEWYPNAMKNLVNAPSPSNLNYL